MTNPCPVNTQSAQIWSLLNQRRQQALYNVPQIRLNLVSPYTTTNFTKYQLDMRRKAEILKYKNQNSKTNNLTKAQKWAQMVSGKYSSNITPFTIESNSDNPNCAADDLIPTLTSACDVPGPPIYLTYDPAVPLYNYVNNQTMSILNTQTSNQPMNQWISYTLPNYIDALSHNIPISNETDIGVIHVSNLASTQSIMSYIITIPVFIWVRGKLSAGSINIDISILSFTLNVYYNNQSILTIPITGPFTGPFTNNLSSVSIDPTKAQNLFYAIQYVGMLSVPNFILNTPSGNIYNLSLTAIMNTENTDSFESGCFYNLSVDNSNVCAVSTVQTQPADYDPSTSDNNPISSSPSTVPYSVGTFIQT